VVEVFAGVGSVARGFSEAGAFNAAYLCDTDPVCRSTYIANGGDESAYELADVRTLDPSRVRERLGATATAGLLGCPPCQGWSAAGRRLLGDDRNRLMGDFFKLVAGLRPKFVVMENVPIVASRAELAAALLEQGREYSWWFGVLNAAAYGVPQSRQRTVVIGYHRDLGVTPTAPRPTHGGSRAVWDYGRRAAVTPSVDSIDSLLGGAPKLAAGRGQHSMRLLYDDDLSALHDLVTVGDAIDDLDGGPPSDYALARGASSTSITGHEPWGHRSATIDAMADVVEGGQRANPSGYYSQAYARLHRRGLARTITTNFHNPGSGRFWHYRCDRTITIREAARLQGFSDDFVFTGTRPEQERQIGNAFPVVWAEALARHVLSEIGSALTHH
jgi:DNA (cytosine-5)-methyltransferase 1